MLVLIHVIFLYDLVGPFGLWIAGGILDGYEKIATVEFIAENNSNNQLVPNLPKPIHNSPSMFLHNETIMICGGSHNLKTCLKLKEGTWTEYNSLKEERNYASVVSTSTATFIFGGVSKDKTFEYLKKNASEWKLGQIRIPDGFQRGCSTAISKDEVWFLGGYITKKRILSFNVNTQTFTELPTKLKQGRFGHQCAYIPGTSNIIITGGYSTSLQVEDSSEIIDVINRNVTEGPSMNSKRAYHGISVLKIDHQERVVVFGGQTSTSSYLKSFEMYNAQTQKWELTNIELSEAKSMFGSMTIKSQP